MENTNAIAGNRDFIHTRLDGFISGEPNFLF